MALVCDYVYWICLFINRFVVLGRLSPLAQFIGAFEGLSPLECYLLELFLYHI